ncbi:MAG: hypothetical protein JWQ07_4724 [Ramlibacter sp.]|nr:hypothetical protein [Ramlibacter sp.]
MSPIARILLTVALVFATAGAHAQAYPARAVKFIVGSAAGSTPDLAARLIGQKLSDKWQVPVVVENRPGVSGTIASDLVAKSPADGYTLLFADSSSWAINPHLNSKLPYDPLKDLAPVAEIAVFPMFLAVSSALPVKDIRELVAYAKKNPGRLNYGSVGNGSIHHISGEIFKSIAGVDITHVPYKGPSQVVVGLMGGEVNMGFMGYTAAAQGVAAGKIRLLGIGTPRRAPAFPDLPTVAESGLPGFAMFATSGILAPAGTPPDVVEKIHDEATAAARSTEIAARFAALGVILETGSTAQFGALMRTEHDKYRQLVKTSGAKID